MFPSPRAGCRTSSRSARGGRNSRRLVRAHRSTATETRRSVLRVESVPLPGDRIIVKFRIRGALQVSGRVDECRYRVHWGRAGAPCWNRRVEVEPMRAPAPAICGPEGTVAVLVSFAALGVALGPIRS